MKRTMMTLGLCAGIAAAAQGPNPAPTPDLGTGSSTGTFRMESPKPPANAKAQPMAKSTEELAEFNSVRTLAQTDLAGAETAAAGFVQKYPESELRANLYSTMLQYAYSKNDADRALRFSDKVIAIEPENTVALVLSATIFAERTEDTDLDRDEKLAKGLERADKAIKTIDTGLVLDARATPEQVQGVKSMLISMAHGAMGQIESIKKDYVAAETHLKSASDVRQDAMTLYRLAVAQHMQKKFKDALASSDKAIAAAEAENNAQVLELAQKEKGILEKAK
ncbi:MAG: hypothetical protein HYX26_06290 [Acidobacteriales bacterium]|nr:hypothetical protein [Terriglobales bacterium]